MSQPTIAKLQRRRGVLPSIYAGNSRAVIYRGLQATKSSNWMIVVSGLFEPVFYLLAMGFGLGGLIGTVALANGTEISYSAYIAPALLAVSAMNGAVYDSTWNVFFKLKFGRIYEGMLQTPLGPFDVALGEILLALLRGVLYAAGFLVVMQVLGLNNGWTALLVIPVVAMIAFGFASLGMGVTSFMQTFQQMDWINFLMLPMFLFSGTFYSIDVYPQAVQWFVQAMPLWHAVELIRALTTGLLSWGLLWHVLYYLVMIALGLVLATTRLKALFQK